MIPRVICGASRVRTGDPLLAKQMRYQLRYSPSEKKSGTWAASLFSVGPGGLEPPTSSLSGMRSNHLSYGPDPYTSKAHDELEYQNCRMCQIQSVFCGFRRVVIVVVCLHMASCVDNRGCADKGHGLL